MRRCYWLGIVFVFMACSIPDTRFQPSNDGGMLTCSPGRADCDRLPQTGCETDLSNAMTCGECNVICGAAVPLCTVNGNGFACTAHCETPAQICGSACVDIAASPVHCGRCGHDCGGGACLSGKCQPVAVADASDQLDSPAALAVNAGSIFWSERTRVRSCPLPLGCALEPQLIADTYDRLIAIAVSEDAVYFSGCRACDDRDHELYRCPVQGCSTSTRSGISFTFRRYEEILLTRSRLYVRDSNEEVRGCTVADCAATNARWDRTVLGDGLSAIVADGDTVYVKSSIPELRICSEASGCAAPATLVGSGRIGAPFRVHAGKAYWLEPGPSTGLVSQCDVANCVSSTFAVDSYGGSEIEADDTGVYWLNQTTATLRHCPLSGCGPGGAGTLATGRVGASQLTLGAGFVYWIEGNAIMKVAKP